MDEKWKLSKKEASGNHCSSSSKFSLSRSFSAKSISSKSPLLRSSSQKSSSCSSSSSSKLPLPRSSSQKSPSISSKCSNLAKEQKARFYIMRRCVAMLVCWRKHGDSWKRKRDGEMIIYRSTGKVPFPFLHLFMQDASWILFVLNSWISSMGSRTNKCQSISCLPSFLISSVQFVIINERATSFYGCKKRLLSTNRFLSNLN